MTTKYRFDMVKYLRNTMHESFVDRSGITRYIDLNTFSNFITNYLAWIAEGAPDDYMFDRAEGICHNFGNFNFGRAVPAMDIYRSEVYAAVRATYEASNSLSSRIICTSAPDLPTVFPFDAASNEFLKRRADRTQHQSQFRLDWAHEYQRALAE